MTSGNNDYKVLMQELQELLVDMQTEELDVDAAINKYKRGQELIAQLKKYLKTAENQIVHHQFANIKETE